MPLYRTFLLLEAVARKNSQTLFTQLAVFCILLIGSAVNSFGQDQLQIENGELVYSRPNESNESQWLYTNEEGQARLRQKNTTIEADSIKNFEARNYAEALGNVYINQADSIDIYSQSGKYYGNERRAVLQGEVALLQDIYTLQTDRLNYNFNTRTATYNTGGELSDTTSTLTSIKGSYNLATEVAIFTDSVVLISPERRIETEELTYYLATNWAEFNGPTTIYEQDKVITTTKGRYNTATGAADIEGNPVIESEGTLFSADNVQLDEQGGIGQADGNVYYLDRENNVELTSDRAKQIDSVRIEATGNVFINSLEDSITLTTTRAIVNNNDKEFFARENVVMKMLSQDTELIADSLDLFDKRGYAIAQGRPFLTTVQDKDSIFLIAETLEAVRQDTLVQQDSVYNFIANRNVKLFKSNLQAIADSSYVNNIDSTITLFKRPVIWNDSTQISADTIRIFLKNKEVERIEFLSRPFAINLENKNLYNQMKGKEMVAYFKNDELDSLFVNGNAETIYYAKDEEDGYVGVDQMKSGQIKAIFLEGKMKEVHWLKQQEGTTHPFQTIDPNNFQFSGFYWRIAERPYSKDYLLIFSGRKEGEIPDIPDPPSQNNGQRDDAIQLGKNQEFDKRSKEDD